MVEVVEGMGDGADAQAEAVSSGLEEWRAMEEAGGSAGRLKPLRSASSRGARAGSGLGHGRAGAHEVKNANKNKMGVKRTIGKKGQSESSTSSRTEDSAGDAAGEEERKVEDTIRQDLDVTSAAAAAAAAAAPREAGEEGTQEQEDNRDTVAYAKRQYHAGNLREALNSCEQVYDQDTTRKDNLLLMGAIHYRMRNFSESIFYNQQAIRVDPNFAEAYGNLGNGLRELGDTKAAIEFYLKAIKLKPRFCDAYNNLASAYLQIGRTKQALETYQMALVLNPNLINAHCNLGNLYKAQGRLEESRKCYLEAIRIRPDFAIAWCNVAGLFKDEGELDTAIAYYQEAIRLEPTLADGFTNMGNALRDAGRLEEAEAAHKKAVELRPDFALAHGNLGNVFYDQGHMDKAIQSFRHAVILQPNFPDAHNNLGNALIEIGDDEGALECYKKCIKLKPDHPHAYNNLGNLLRERGMVHEAMHCFMTACRLMPRFAAAHSNLGSILKDQGKIEQSLAHYQECVAIDPKFAAAYSNLGNVYKDTGRLGDAIKCFTTAIRLDADLAVGYNNLGSAYRDAGRLDDAISCYRKAIKLKPDYADSKVNLIHSLTLLCDWRNRKEDVSELVTILKQQLGACSHFETTKPTSVLPALSVQPFHLFALSMHELGQESDMLLDIAEIYAKQSQRILELQNLPRLQYRARHANERLKIGYVSSHFGNEALGFMFQSVFGTHNHSEFEVYCFATSPSDQSRIRKRIEREAEHFHCLSGLSPFESAKVIHSFGVHVLFNVDGYSAGAQMGIFAMQPCPVQISLVNQYTAPLCADYIQYTVIDKELFKASDIRRSTENKDQRDDQDGGDNDDQQEQNHHQQKQQHGVIVLPRTVMISDHQDSAREVLNPKLCPTRAQYGLEEDRFVFACFTQGYKIDPKTFETWCKILERVPESVLWMLNSPALAQANLKAEARSHGIREDRLVFSDLEPRNDHIKRLFLADLFLDTTTCNHQSAAMDILWAGVPLLTCAPETGGRMSARIGASLLSSMEVSDGLVAESLHQYQDMAVKLASNADHLWTLRKKIEQARITSPVFDVPGYCLAIETAVAQAWARHEQGLPLQDIRL
ncbi:Probable UDP-N-acetylglucosamine--peptide N-acetylglucosaminyltransferase SEC (Protein SECRET AGENT) [Durusdinium trenchii]|uniref:protein O-GlcNAc transferase n=1 Tax=Durusdinium trenchii TaxID=1381693 RepID=A0ABP0IEM8_9DINO